MEGSLVETLLEMCNDLIEFGLFSRRGICNTIRVQ